MRQRLLIAALAMGMVGTGCGGGGGGGTPPIETTHVRATIHWPARSRVLAAPGSALSAVITLAHARPDGLDFTWTIERGADPTDHTSSYTSPDLARTGEAGLVVRFYAGTGGAGSVVASGSGAVTVLGDGTGVGGIVLAGVIATVSIPIGQTVDVGQTRDLPFTARDASGSIVAVSPGSAHWTLTSGGAALRLGEDGAAEGLAPGTAVVSVGVDGKTSPSQQVAVLSNTQVSVSPSSASLLTLASKAFVVTVTNAPDTAVTWTVREGSTGGTITQAGIYTAPATAGTYHVVATSVYDPSKSAEAAVAVSEPTHVTVEPNAATLSISAQQTFTATVTGAPNSAVTWSVNEGPAGGTVSTTGVYTAPGTAGTYHVTATSVYDPAASATAAVTVQSGGSTVIVR